MRSFVLPCKRLSTSNVTPWPVDCEGFSLAISLSHCSLKPFRSVNKTCLYQNQVCVHSKNQSSRTWCRNPGLNQGPFEPGSKWRLARQTSPISSPQKEMAGSLWAYAPGLRSHHRELYCRILNLCQIVAHLSSHEAIFLTWFCSLSS